jgi:hypothetical protein
MPLPRRAVQANPGEAFGPALPNGSIGARRLDGLRRPIVQGNNHRHLPANEISGERRQLVNTTLAGLNGYVAAHNVTGIRQTLVECW